MSCSVILLTSFLYDKINPPTLPILHPYLRNKVLCHLC
nr:MAG TPA: hypothetical protein [Caudoviricetes sp.]